MTRLEPVPSDPEQLHVWIADRRLAISPFDNPEIVLPDPPEDAQELTVTVTLEGSEPPIWRRIVVAGDTRLDHLHAILQATMGWTDSHLHRYRPGTDQRAPHFVTDDDLDDGEEGTNEATARLDQVLLEVIGAVLFERLELEARWFGKGNREDHTPPIRNCRRAATQLGLLRKAKGRLAPTAAATRVASDPAALFAHVAERLPLGKPGIEQEAGWFALLGLAGGTDRFDHGQFASTMLLARGWEVDGRSLADYEASRFLWPTVAALTGPTQEVARQWAPWVQVAAAAIVRPRTRA